MLSRSLEVTDDNCVKPQTGHLHSKLPGVSRHHTIQEAVKMKLEKSNYELITEIALVHLMLAHYRNQLLHLFVPEAMLALSLPGDMPCSTGSDVCVVCVGVCSVGEGVCGSGHVVCNVCFTHTAYALDSRVCEQDNVCVQTCMFMRVLVRCGQT